MAVNNLQPTYGLSYPVGYPGMVANGETYNRISRTIEDSAGIGFGKAAFRGVGDHGITATPTAGTFLGITMADLALQPLAGVVAGGAAADTFPQYASVGLINEGEIWVLTGEAVNDGDPAYVTAAGALMKTATSNTAIPAVFDTTTSGAGLARLRVRRS